MGEDFLPSDLNLESQDLSIRGTGILEPASKTAVFQQAATETGLRVSITPTKTPYVVSAEQKVPAVRLMSQEKDLEPFWKKVAELEAAATQKAG